MTITVLPAVLRNLNTWVVWRLMQRKGEKAKKIPFYVGGGVREGDQGSPADISRLVSLDQAMAYCQQGGFSGVGLAMLPQNGLVALDFDDCVAPGGVVDARLAPLLRGTYAEYSPSGTGVRAFFVGSIPDRKDSKAQRRGEVNSEFFHSTGFVTVTGNVLGDTRLMGWDQTVAPLPGHVTAFYDSRFGAGASLGRVTAGGLSGDLANVIPPIGMSLEKATAMVAALDANCDYDDWIQCGQALHHEFSGSEAAMNVWKQWSKTAQPRPSDVKPLTIASDRQIEMHWGSFGRYRGQPITATWLLKHAKAAKVGARYDALDEWKARILAATSDQMLRETLAPDIAKDERLETVEREAIAQLLIDRLRYFGIRLPIAKVRALIAPPETKVPTVRGQRPLTEFGNAERMLDRYGKSLMYVPELDAWHVWTGVYWRRVTDVEIEHYAKETVRDMVKEAVDLNEEQVGEFYAFCALSQQYRMIKSMVALASSDPRVMVPAAELDKHAYLLCVQNGVFNFRTGELMPPDQALHMTKCCACEYRPGAAGTLFRQTVLEVFSGDKDMSEFFQRVIGYTAMGDPNQDFMVIPHGNGSNGKSTVLGAIRKVFGTYAKAADASSFISDAKGGGNAGGPREDLVRLHGTRFCYVNEPDENGELREGAVKSMTGGDMMPARGLFAKSTIEIKPTWVVYMPTNHKPIVKGGDNGIWRRLMLVPFMRNFDLEATSAGQGVLNGSVVNGTNGHALDGLARWGFRLEHDAWGMGNGAWSVGHGGVVNGAGGGLNGHDAVSPALAAWGFGSVAHEGGGPNLFTVAVRAAKDVKRAERLDAESDGILAWIIEGGLAYLQRGLAQPAVVREARDAYRSQMDLLAEWLDECCELSPDYSEESSRLWQSWESWAKERGSLQYIKTSVSLGRKLESRFPLLKGTNGKRSRSGLKLVSHANVNDTINLFNQLDNVAIKSSFFVQ